jgi:hypothetical protein
MMDRRDQCERIKKIAPEKQEKEETDKKRRWNVTTAVYVMEKRRARMMNLTRCHKTQ